MFEMSADCMDWSPLLVVAVVARMRKCIMRISTQQNNNLTFKYQSIQLATQLKGRAPTHLSMACRVIIINIEVFILNISRRRRGQDSIKRPVAEQNLNYSYNYLLGFQNGRTIEAGLL